MDFRGKKYERGSNWSDPEVVELLQLWADESVQMELESCLRNQHVFNRIAEVLREKGIHRTGDQCREKIKKMKLEYRRIKDNQKTVRGGRTWKFYEVMDRVLTNRPALSYSSLGGSVIAQQVLQGAGGDGFHLHPAHLPAFTSPPPGAFIFGHPPKAGELMEIKCEEVDSDDASLTADPPPELLYQVGSGDEPEGDPALGLDREGSVGGGRGEIPADACLSPSGFSEQNMACSSGTGGSAGPCEAGRQCSSSLGSVPHLRKRRKAGRGRESLDEALVRFLNSQRVAEERFLALEECRLQREAEAEERRVQLEQRRAEMERQHEFRMFGVFAHMVSTLRPETPQSTAAPKTPPPADATTSSRVKAPQLGDNGGSHLSQPHSSPDSPRASTYLSRRGNFLRNWEGILQEGFNLYQTDKHDEDKNPNGIINLGTSENKLSLDLLSKRLMQSDMFQVEPPLLQYPDWRGHLFLREEVARFLTYYCKAPTPLKPQNVVVVNGCSSLYCLIATVLCDPDDGILIPTPFYGAITEDVTLYSGVRMVYAHIDCQQSGSEDRPFHLTVEKLERALEEARQEGINVRAIILINPHNPLGDVYSPSEMQELLEFAKREELHAIIDEIYMLSVFDETTTFHSVLSFSKLPDPQRTHVLWGISKDFAASGIRVGTLYSENSDVICALGEVLTFHGVPGTIQHQVAQLLHDRDWINQVYLPTNRARLKTAHHLLASELKGLGIPFLNRPSGFFIWADFRKYLREETFEEERTLWRLFLRYKVLLSCGKAFECSTPGWFRIVFADKAYRVQLGMQRLREALAELNQGDQSEDRNKINKSGKERKPREEGRTKAANRKKLSQAETKSQDPHFSLDEDDDVVQVSCLSVPPAAELDSLIGVLRQKMRSSDWLEKNTPELFAQDNPEVFEVFSKLIDRPKE
ncbi:1-aminocyclopropane-1-carboxylate synthase-like protein 1 isoform X1 [Amia ocellicauda]|uniref:1-aminocyclopropane-1-carboxylate synthase-like protein 1 isoform X1 n=2 Tax=Amia ocellicauda TaxID=2972642 RepID=UPI0034644BE5